MTPKGLIQNNNIYFPAWTKNNNNNLKNTSTVQSTGRRPKPEHEK